MRSTDPEPVARQSAGITAERLEALRDLLPEAFTETGVDLVRLRAALGDFVDDGPERAYHYSAAWASGRAGR